MAKFAIMASELKSLKKSMEDRKLAELKKEIIEILKKQDEKDFKKAIDYFESQELHFTHLEKSLVSGKWVQKAGYGIGTVRIWKGKKYKKIAPGKWARVFDKEGRGTNIAIGKLIARVQKIDNVEDLMAFVMQNKQRFVDENGVDLPVLDKLRAAVDARNGNVGSKETSKPAENKELSMKEKVLIATDEGSKKELGRGKMYKKHVTEIQKYANSNINDIPENLKTITDFIKYQDSMSSPDYKQAGRDYARLHNHNLAREIWQNVADGKAEWDDNGYLKLDKNGLLARPEKKEEPADNRESEEVDPRTGKENYWIIDNRGNRLTNKDAIKRIQGNLAKIDELENSDEPRKDMKIKDLKFDNEYLRDRLNSDDRKESEAEKHQNRSDAMKGNKNAYKGAPKDVAKYIFSKTNDMKKRNSMLLEAFNERYGTKEEGSGENNNRYAMMAVSELYTKVKQAKPHSDEWYNAINNYDEAAEMYRMVIGDDGIEHYNKEVENIRMKPNYSKEKLPESSNETPMPKPSTGVYNPSESTNLETKKAIAENKSIGENEVQMPYSKELAAEMESLKNCVSRDSVKEFMQRVYYENGNLVATDGRRIKVVKVGELNGIDNGTYVDIDITKNGINIKKNDFEGQFPKYDKVIPDDLSQKVILNNKVIKDKIKEMKKDGAIDKKVGMVQLEFKDGKVYLDDTEIGEAKNINLKYSDDWGPAREETNIINVNADYLVNALNGNSSTLMLGERADKAMGISTDSTTNIIMPMVGSHEKMDYSAGRSEKAAEKEKKAAELKRNKEYNQELCKVFESKYGYDLVENMASHIDERLPDFSNEDLQREYTRLGLNFDKLMEKNATTINTILDKKTSTDLKTAYLYSRVMKEHPEVKEKIAAELEKRGISVKKSLFDDFIVDVFDADDEEELEHELYEGETEYNDYSAEQPELFNSTAMKVREALDRIRNQVL